MKKQNIYVQITAGKGPVECCWVVTQLLNVFLFDLEKNGLSHEIIQRNEGPENRTLSSVLIKVSGVEVTQKLNHWKGSIQWIGQSPFRKYHKRKNWFVAVDFFEEKETFEFKESDLEYQTFRASGPGGQHRNKVETAVRVLHRPSGLQITASDSKSQIQNKKNAIAKMEQVFQTNALDIWQKQMDDQWSAHLQLERGNPVKVFKGENFN